MKKQIFRVSFDLDATQLKVKFKDEDKEIYFAFAKATIPSAVKNIIIENLEDEYLELENLKCEYIEVEGAEYEM